MPIPYYHVDSFTAELFAGNPAGVCMLSAFPAESTMQKIAAENRHSETAFVVPLADGDFDLRWFTPEVEDDLCGHATLASAYVVADDARQVRALSPDLPALAKLNMGIGGTIVTAPGEADVDYVCRFFPPSVGIDEDPATGSIQCTLAPYWAERLGKQTLRVQQLSARGGSMRCEMIGDRVKIAGKARLYLQGTIEL